MAADSITISDAVQPCSGPSLLPGELAHVALGGLTVRIGNYGERDVLLGPWNRFRTPAVAVPDVSITVHAPVDAADVVGTRWEDLTGPIRGAHVVFRRGRLLEVLSLPRGSRWSVMVRAWGPGPMLTRVAVWDGTYSEFRVIPSARRETGTGQTAQPMHLFRHPWGKVFVAAVAERGGGLLFHGAGVVWQGRCLLFAGPSGAGKTTMARLWLASGLSNVALLSEDRVIVKRDGDGVLVYGAPYLGDNHTGRCDTGGVPLKAVVFLAHSKANHLTPVLDPTQACLWVYCRTFHLPWSRGSYGYALAESQALAQHVPIYQYGFRPSVSAVQLLASVLSR